MSVRNAPGSTTTSGGSRRLRRVSFVALLALVTTVMPLAAMAADDIADGIGVELTFEDFDALQAGQRGTVGASVAVTDRGGLGDHDPLRVLATLTESGEAVVGAEVGFLDGDGSWVETTTDAQGRFFYPPPGHAPMTLAGHPSLLTSTGVEHQLAFTLPPGDYDLEAQFVLASEQSDDVWRLGGADRIETAALISQAYFDPGVDVVFVARADDFPDALAGGPASGVAGAPLLLVHTDSIPTATAGELDRLDPARIVILGGEAAVSSAVEAALDPYTTGSVDRLAGADRYATAAAIAGAFFDPGVGTVYIATGLNWPDAVSGGAAAAFDGSPILLVQTDSIPPASAATLQALQPGRIVVLGGTEAVSPAVEAALRTFTNGPVERYGGATRYETSAAISAATFPAGSVPVAFIATGQAFPDVLTGVPAAARFGAPVLLVTDPIPDALADELMRLRDGGELDLVVLGGTAAVSSAVEEALGVFTGTSEPDIDDLIPLGGRGSVDFVITDDGGGGGVTPTTPTTPTPTTPPPAEDFDNTVTIPLHWQNQYRADEAQFGGVDDYAAFHLDPEGAGEVTFGWDTDGTTVGIWGETELSAQATSLTFHDGGLREEVAAEFTLPVPTFAGAAADAPHADDRGLYAYDLDGTVPDAAALIALLDAETGYVSVQTTLNPDGEVRGQQLGAGDGGLTDIVPVYKYLEFHELGVGTNTGEDQTSFNLIFDADIDFAEASKDWPKPEDFVLTRLRDGISQVIPVLRVRGSNAEWQPYPKPDLRLHLDTDDVIEDGDVVTVEVLDSAAAKLLPDGRNSSAGDLMDSWRTRCTVVLSVPAMTSEPCGTPSQPGLSDFTVTPIDTAPEQAQTFSVTIEEPGIPPRPDGHVANYDAEPWELWIDLVEVSHDGLIDYSESTWTATIDGTEVGTVGFWEYEEVERFRTVWEPYLVFTHDEPGPIAGDLVLTGTGIDGSDAAVFGEDIAYDTFVVRYDTGRADYATIEANHVAQPTITLEPADAVALAEAGTEVEVTATYTDVVGEPVADAELRFWAEQGVRPGVVEVPIDTVSTDGDGQATVTYVYDGRDVEVGAPLIDLLRVEYTADPYVDAVTTVSWATGVATNTNTGDTFHDLNDAVIAAEAGDTITAEGTFTSEYGTQRDDRIEVDKPLTLQGNDEANLLGSFDLRADDITLRGFHITRGDGKQFAVRTEGDEIVVTGNEIDATGMNAINVRNVTWGPETRLVTITDNEISNAAVGIHADVDKMKGGEPVPFVLEVDLVVTGNTFSDNGTGIYWSPDPGSTEDISGNTFIAGEGTNVFVEDATVLEDDMPLGLEAILASNTFDNGNDYGPPEAEIVGTKIVPTDPTHEPSIVRVVEHGAGTGNTYSVIEYTRGVACDADGAAVASQFVLDRGEPKTPNRVGSAVTCGYEGNASWVRIEWDGNPSFPNEITYTEHETDAYRIHNEHELAAGGHTEAFSPQTVGSPFPKPVDESPVHGAVYLELDDATIDDRWFTPGQTISPVDLRVSIANRSDVPEGGLGLWFDGARPGEGFIAGETICAELLTVDSCTLIGKALADNIGFVDNTDLLTEATLQVNPTAAVGTWQLRFWVVDAVTEQPYFSDTFSVLIVPAP